VYNRTPPADAFQEKCLSLGASRVTFIQCNVSEFESIERLIKQV
jgi:hypothetical protein